MENSKKNFKIVANKDIILSYCFKRLQLFDVNNKFEDKNIMLLSKTERSLVLTRDYQLVFALLRVYFDLCVMKLHSFSI